MTTIFERVKNALDMLAPVSNAMGVMLVASGELPDQYLTYSLIDAPPAFHADDEEKAREYQVQVTIYSRAGLVELPDVDGAMTAAGFTKGPFRQLPRNVQSGHYGLAKDYYFYEEGDLLP